MKERQEGREGGKKEGRKEGRLLWRTKPPPPSTIYTTYDPFCCQ